MVNYLFIYCFMAAINIQWLTIIHILNKVQKDETRNKIIVALLIYLVESHFELFNFHTLFIFYLFLFFFLFFEFVNLITD